MDISPKDLRDHILKMASLVEASLSGALNLDKSIEEIFELERKINEFHMLIDDACFKYIALKGPAAKDLRTAIAVMKINADLERMGDQAVKIKRQYISIGREILQIKNMALEVNIMVKNALDSFVRSNIRLATDVIEYDQEINSLNQNIVRHHVNMIKNNEMGFDDGYTIIKISKNLERIGDHAKNIAEDVIFLESGSDIRHNLEFKAPKKD